GVLHRHVAWVNGDFRIAADFTAFVGRDSQNCWGSLSGCCDYSGDGTFCIEIQGQIGLKIGEAAIGPLSTDDPGTFRGSSLNQGQVREPAEISTLEYYVVIAGEILSGDLVVRERRLA